MYYKDEKTGYFYRVSPQPAKRGLYFIEYLNRAGNGVFKRLPDCFGCRFRDKLEQTLTAGAQRNGWIATEPPELSPASSEPGDTQYIGGTQMMLKYENEMERRRLIRKIKRLQPFFEGRLCYHTHCQWKIGERNACCLPRCLHGLKYKGRDEEKASIGD